ncbi:MAG: hypothetical protein ABW022_20230 [Actinoplanes sp.]
MTDQTPPEGYPVGNTDPSKRGRNIPPGGVVIGQEIPEDKRRKATGQEKKS